MKLHRHASHENNNSTTHKWPQFVADDVQHDNIYIMTEFICIHCRNSLTLSTPHMTIVVISHLVEKVPSKELLSATELSVRLV